MINRKPFLLILLTATVLLFANCPKPPNSNNSLRIGAILDLTGPGASFGQMQRQGIDLAVEVINASPKCNLRIAAIIEDSRLDPKTALAAATKLIEVDKVSAVCSITGSSMALTTAPLFNQAKIPIVDSLSSAAALTSEGGPFYFRIQPSDNFAGEYLVTWAKENPTVSRAAIVSADSDWGQGLRDSITGSARNKGLIIIDTETAKLGETDFRSMILRIRRQNPDLLFLVAHPQEAGLIIKQMAELNYKLPTMGSDTLSTEEVRTAAGKALDGVMFCLTSAGSGKSYEDFQNRFRSRYGKDATINSIKPYDSVMILYDTACKTGPSAEQIYSSLQGLTSFQAISGNISFDKNGDISTPQYDRLIYRGDTFSKIGSPN